jgi:uncharacterized protein
MADPKNPGQFGNRKDTIKQAKAGGAASPGKFGGPEGADPSDAGRRGAEAQPREAKVEGGKNSHKND